MSLVRSSRFSKTKLFRMEDLWQDVAERVTDLNSKPEKFLEPSDSIFQKTKILAKVLYDAAKILEDGKFKSVTLPELIIENFDEEQVWAGVELQNAAFEADYLDRVRKLELQPSRAFDLFRGVAKAAAPVESDDEETVEFDDDGDDGDIEDDVEDEEVKICLRHAKSRYQLENGATRKALNSKIALRVVLTNHRRYLFWVLPVPVLLPFRSFRAGTVPVLLSFRSFWACTGPL